MGLGGNAWEWQETEVDFSNDNPLGSRILRGGSFTSILDASKYLRSDTWADPTDLGINGVEPGNQGTDVGFRIAGYSSNAVPEPSSIALLSLAAVYFPIRRCWHRYRQSSRFKA